MGADVSEAGPRQARDVVAFGQETGRALSDGRIVGRAEPFAKVFPSSRAVKRVVGAVAWAVLEDIALDARIDDAGRLVSETNVRRIAENLALNKDTITRHLAKLREHGFVLQEESRQLASGRWEPCRYVLDPSACVERFTTTPSENRRSAPCPRSSDTASEAVSENTGHGVTGQGDFGHYIEHRDVREQHPTRADAGPRDAAEEQPDDAAAAKGGSGDVGDADADGVVGERAPEPVGATPPPPADGDLHGELVAAGVAGHVASDLVARHSRRRIEDAVAVAAARPMRNPAGWIVTALRDGWDLSDRLAELGRAQARQQEAARTQHAQAQREGAFDEEQRRSDGWSQAVSAGLSERQLAAAAQLVTGPLPDRLRRSVPAVHAQLVTWAAAVARRFPDWSLSEALRLALVEGLDLRDEVACSESLPDPPPCGPPAAGLRGRLTELLEPSPTRVRERERSQ